MGEGGKKDINAEYLYTRLKIIRFELDRKRTGEKNFSSKGNLSQNKFFFEFNSNCIFIRYS